ncbi:f65721b8-3178-4fee-ab56-862a58cfbcc9 [Thermothielavioides terrestris]|uniref:F65721b8-3178-4fee-ab56-862a58cfbcc9 n=1 Tax=Thermothielavioides terrestris TaxID=2587410 RepID=A0A446BYL7_9PEZI|nr:f65721b8-3178-4fee-ab56-862a58cfbcc9 [Thermothielavioides terrestris]
MKAGLPPGSSTPRPKPKKPTSELKPRKRPGRKPAPSARQIYLQLNPHFIRFRCEWQDCPAELQNLETLRKHILVVHGPPAQQLTCKWATCVSPPLPTRDAFAAHVETAHLCPFLWHAGDGPRNSTPSPSFPLHPRRPASNNLRHHPRQQTDSSNSTSNNNNNNNNSNNTNDADDPLPAYLFDAAGNQVTPSVRDQQTETDEDRRRRAARIARALAQRDRNAPDEPEYTARELEDMAAAAAAKRAAQRMFREYADRVRRGGEGWEGWRGLLG